MEENNQTPVGILPLIENSFTERFSTDEDKRQFAENFITAFSDNPKEKYDDDFYFDILKPIVSSYIQLKEDTAKELRYLRELIADKQCSNEATDYAVEIIETMIGSVDDVLLDYDVQPFRCEDSRFNPKRQNVVKKILTEQPEQAKTVAESLGEGYERKGVVITKERVSAYSIQ
jgi:hypothetical protein